MIKPQAKTHGHKSNTDDNPSIKENESSSSDSENKSDEKSRHKHGEPVNNPHHTYSNLDADSDNTCGGTTDDSTKNIFYNE